MLSEVRLVIGSKEARLILKKSGEVVEDELWVFDTKISAAEAQQITKCVFDDAYQMMQYAVYGEQ